MIYFYGGYRDVCFERGTVDQDNNSSCRCYHHSDNTLLDTPTNKEGNASVDGSSKAENDFETDLPRN